MESATADLGRRYLITEVSYKPYPVCGTQQIPISIFLKLMDRHNIKAEDIKEVVERVPARELNVPGSDNPGPFENAAQPLLSSQFCAAATLLGNPMASPEFYKTGYKDPQILALARKVRLIGEPDRKIPEITVILNNGQSYSIEEGKEKGTLVPNEEHILTKFNDMIILLTGFCK